MSRRTETPDADRAERAATWAVRLTDGEVPADQQDAFEAWLEADPRNGKALDEVLGGWYAVDRYAASAEVMALREAALASGRKAMRRGGPAVSRRAAIWGMIAATVLLTVSLGGAWLWLSPRTYETGVGERRLVVLTDGSKVSLDAATVVRVGYSRAGRRLWLDRGRAKFDVERDPLRPFSVTAGDKVVVATGTAFSVELIRKEVRVVLYEGRVALLERPSGGAGPARGPSAPHRLSVDRLLSPGREMTLPEQPGPAATAIRPTVAQVDPVRSLSWEAGFLVFEDEPLAIVVERMNRYATKPLALGDVPVGNLRVSGVFRAGDTEALTQGLDAAFGVRARTEAEAIRLFNTRFATAAP